MQDHVVNLEAFTRWDFITGIFFLYILIIFIWQNVKSDSIFCNSAVRKYNMSALPNALAHLSFLFHFGSLFRLPDAHIPVSFIVCALTECCKGIFTSNI